MPENQLVPREQRSIDFYGDELVAVQTDDGGIWIPVRRMCEVIGIAFRAQLARIERDPVMREELRSVSVTITDGRTFEMACLPLKYVRAWLFGINASRVKPELQDKLIRYQREVIEIIDRAFARPAAPAGLDGEMVRAMRDNTVLQAQLWDMLLKRLAPTEELMQEHDDLLMDHSRQLWQHGQTIEHVLSELAVLRHEQGNLMARFSDVTRLLPAPSDTIAPAQKAAIKALVDDIVAAAVERGIRLGQGRNDYPAVWDAFKRRWDLARYDELQVRDYDAAIGWLKAWLDRIRSEAPNSKHD